MDILLFTIRGKRWSLFWMVANIFWILVRILNLLRLMIRGRDSLNEEKIEELLHVEGSREPWNGHCSGTKDVERLSNSANFVLEKEPPASNVVIADTICKNTASVKTVLEKEGGELLQPICWSKEKISSRIWKS
ncbi:uncharacterized protein LOC110006956 isoform X2 [Amborella trichopoda]|uniref:uncharacterized protein LOC110006956 isoform X2 n=1 Tax=Amborella trichopoda TaxID=13333 RepID=UPI0009C11C0A|nr:uncharacterized protein LOC110006956 isoform X2 [Amborella trichopoda]|eukprot:XP_020520799.1 uncharacterized protein LOC110006956 isoform X2 [Amborella trichopoda]